MILFLQNLDTVGSDNEKRFNYIYDKYYRYAYTIAFNVVKSTLEMEEIMQEVFLNVWRTIDIITDEHSARAWISTIARNTAINILRTKITKAKNILDIDDDVIYSATPDFVCDPTELIISRDSVEGVYSEIKKMDKRYADVLLLSFKFHLSPGKIAEYLKRNPKTVYTQLGRGKELLKERLICAERSQKNE